MKEINVIEPMQLMEPGRARVEWQQAQPDGKDMSVTWEELAQVVAANEPLLAQIRTAVRRPHLNFRLDYNLSIGEMLLPHLAKVRQVGQWFAVSALLKLRENDTSGAIGELECALLLANLQRKELVAVSQLVAIAMDSVSLEVTWELLQTETLDDSDLTRLQVVWSMSEQSSSMQRAFEREVATNSKWLHDARNSAKKWWSFLAASSVGGASTSATPQVLGGWVDQAFAFVKRSMHSLAYESKILHWKYFGSYNDEWIYIQLSKEQIDLMQALHAGTPANNLLSDYGKQCEEMTQLAQTYGSELVSDIFTAALRTPEKVIQNESYRRMAVVVIALKRYQLKHGKWPETLEATVPEFLTAVPVDPADGQPLRYARKEKGEFLLYTLGVNHRDEGGDSARAKKNEKPSFHAGNDWVWPMPVNEVVRN